MSKTGYFFLLLLIACKAAQPNADQSRTSEVETGQEEVLTKVDTMNNPDDLNPQVEEPEYVIIDYSQF